MLARRPSNVRLTITTDPEGLRGCSPLDPDEGELLRRLRAGDEDAFACLVDRHHAAMVRLLVDDLPTAQRQVVTLRDVEGLPSRDVCGILGISEGNQRVLLHRARARIRQHLEREAVW